MACSRLGDLQPLATELPALLSSSSHAMYHLVTTFLNRNDLLHSVRRALNSVSALELS